MKPTLGRILHVSIAGTWVAAIVIDEAVDGETFEVQLFAPTNAPYQPPEKQRLKNAGEGETWRWPPRSAS